MKNDHDPEAGEGLLRRVGRDALASIVVFLVALPLCMGIAWDHDNVFWVFDGKKGQVAWYDFGEDHGPGNEYHGDGRYQFLRDEDVPVSVAQTYFHYLPCGGDHSREPARTSAATVSVSAVKGNPRRPLPLDCTSRAALSTTA